ncbi:MAG: substrate-binding domain-containing protein [Chloroflexota bacterium]|nr:substrate-binding domain-containing protein [Chloroflexia bacterium]MDQ3228071.1 substrate-binding domain-containing protein [Chloroflexota bacterium]
MSQDQRERQIDRLLGDYFRGRLSRRQLARRATKLGGLSLVLTTLAPELRPALAAPTPRSGRGIRSSAMQGTQPVSNMTTEELLEFYDQVLPFTDILPLEASEIGGDPIVIGFSQTGFNHPWRVEMIKSAQAEVARHPNVSMVITDGNVDISKQNNDVDDLLAQDVAAVVMSPVESAGLAPAALKVMAAGKPLILLDRDVAVEKTVFIGQSNVTMAKGVADVMVEMLDGEGSIVELTGLIGSSPAIDRQKGMYEALAEAAAITVVAAGDAEWIRDPAVALMDDFLVANPQINAVFSHAEESSWGAQFSIARAGRCADNILQFTHDASNAGFQSVKDGLFAADGNYSPFIGDVGVRAALMALQGMEIPDLQDYEFEGKLYRLPDLPVVTAENVDEWLGKGWGDFAPPEDPCTE